MNVRMILAVNAGSSSLRLALYSKEGERLARTRLEGDLDGARLRDYVRRNASGRPSLAVHRIVHGGRYEATCLIDEEVEREIERACEIVPLHNPPALRAIRLLRELFGRALPQAAAFDTALFARLPEVAATYALPADLAAEHGLRRRGFHGLAHRSLLDQLDRLQPGADRVVTLQLGAGCSIAAFRDRRPLDVSMGFSPLEGLVMATRCGDLDPGLLLYLQRRHGWGAQQLDDVLNQRSGLLGVSGTSGDMRELVASEAPRARLAVDLFCYRARKYVGAYLAVLGGAQAIVFGGGTGEHQPEVRARILQGMQWAGIELDPALNGAAASGQAARISKQHSAVALWVIAVDEEAMLLEEARALLGTSAKE